MRKAFAQMNDIGRRAKNARRRLSKRRQARMRRAMRIEMRKDVTGRR